MPAGIESSLHYRDDLVLVALIAPYITIGKKYRSVPGKRLLALDHKPPFPLDWALTLCTNSNREGSLLWV